MCALHKSGGVRYQGPALLQWHEGGRVDGWLSVPTDARDTGVGAGPSQVMHLAGCYSMTPSRGGEDGGDVDNDTAASGYWTGSVCTAGAGVCLSARLHVYYTTSAPALGGDGPSTQGSWDHRDRPSEYQGLRVLSTGKCCNLCLKKYSMISVGVHCSLGGATNCLCTGYE